MQTLKKLEDELMQVQINDKSYSSKLDKICSQVENGLIREVKSQQALKTFIDEQINQNNTQNKSGDLTLATQNAQKFAQLER